MTVENNHRWPTPNHNYVPEFQMSGIPFVTTLKFSGSYQKIIVNFEQVTRWIEILNHNDNSNTHIYMFFNENEADSFISNVSKPAVFQTSTSKTPGCKHVRIDKSTYTPRYEIKCKSIVLVGMTDDIVSVIAGLTNVPSDTFPDQKYDNGFRGVETKNIGTVGSPNYV